MKKILIVIDMLNDFCHADGVLAKDGNGNVYAEKIIPVVKEVIDENRDNDGHTIYPIDNHPEDDKEFEKFLPHAVRGTWGGLIIDEIKMFEEPHGYVIPKTRYSGFYNSKLEYTLDMLKPELVEVVGVYTSICVMDTVGGLSNRDYRVRVISDGVADFDPEMHEMALKRMANIYGAEVMTLAERNECDG